MIIYIDLLFLEHFIINYMLIGITQKVLKLKSNLFAKIFSSFIATFYSIVVIITQNEILNNTISKVILAILIICISFMPSSVNETIKDTLVFFVITYFVGGIASSMISTVSIEQICVLVAIAVSYFLIMIMKKFLRSSNYICNLEIKIDEKIVSARALLDTGHNLSDLITGDTVIIVNEKVVKELSEELLYVLKEETLSIPERYKAKIRMITYNSVGEEGVLMGVRCEKVSLYYNGNKIENKKTVMALSKQKIKRVDALIGTNLIEGGNVVGNTFIIEAKS